MNPCPDDFELLAFVEGERSGARAKTIDEHIDSCDLCREAIVLLCHPEPVGFQVGDTISRFQLKGELGQGAMGVVFAGEDPELRRQVAIKLMREEANSPRLEREAIATASVSHPNVITLHEFGRTEEHLFFVMERGDETLREWMERSPSLNARVRAFFEVCAGLRAAHETGLIHRDIKPDNVLMCGEVAKLSDFGLVGLDTEGSDPSPAVQSFAEDAPLRTRTGALMGTPAYMAPELWEGLKADARSDQFALAVLGWELLVGSRPFRGATIAELRAAHDQAPRGTNAALSENTLEALRRGFATDPQSRYHSIDAFERAVRDSLDRREDIADESRNRAPLAIMMIAGAGLIAAGVVMTRGAQEAPETTEPPPLECQASAFQNPTLSAEWERTRLAECESLPTEERERWLEQEVAVAGAWSELEVSNTQMTRLARVNLETLRRDSNIVQALLRGESPEAEGELALWSNLNLSSVRRERADFEGAEQALHAASRLSSASGEVWTAEVYLEEARLLGSRGRFEEAEAALRRAEVPIERSDAIPLRSKARFVRALLRIQAGDASAARPLLAVLEGDPWVQTEERLIAAGNAARLERNFEDALAAHRQALRLAGAGPQAARHHHNIAGVLRNMGESDAAKAEYQLALACLAEGPSAQRALTTNSLGLLALASGELDDALVHFQRSAQLYDELEHGHQSLARFNEAFALLALERPEEAERLLQSVQREDQRRWGLRSQRYVEILSGLALARWQQGKLEEGSRAIQEALEIAREMDAPSLVQKLEDSVARFASLRARDRAAAIAAWAVTLADGGRLPQRERAAVAPRPRARRSVTEMRTAAQAPAPQRETLDETDERGVAETETDAEVVTEAETEPTAAEEPAEMEELPPSPPVNLGPPPANGSGPSYSPAQPWGG